MRITNKIMQLNSINNINTNKINEDTLNNQMASGKKVLRPSDNPVLAIRSLRLRSTLTDINQYLEKNVEDADSWLKVTEDSLDTVNNCLKDAWSQCNKGAVDHLTTENRKIILDDLKSLRDEVYASGDADYAGRGVFTGYRTSTKLLFQTPETVRYDITEPVRKDAVEQFTYVKLNSGEAQGGQNSSTIDKVNAGNYDSIDYPKETDIYDTQVYRIRLSYMNMDNPINDYAPATGSVIRPIIDPTTPTNPDVTVTTKLDVNGDPEFDKDGHPIYVVNGEEMPIKGVDATKLPAVTYTDFRGQQYQIPIGVISQNDKDWDPYLAVNDDTFTDYIYRNPKGELFNSKDFYGDPAAGTKGQQDTIYYKNDRGDVISEDEWNKLTDLQKEKYSQVRGPLVNTVNINGVAKEPKAIFIPETGELILNEAAKEILSGLVDYEHTADNDEGEISITYTKSNYKKGELRPEHYFEATQYDKLNPAKTILHNKGGIKDEAGNQIISYDVGFNQEVRVNTLAGDVYTPEIQRDIDDLIAIIEQVGLVETTIKELETTIERLDPTDEIKMTKAKEALATAKKAYTHLEDKMQKMFENGMTRFSNHQAKATLALTEVGTRTSKLTLVKDRLTSQQSNFEELVANNDQVDIAEVATMLKSAQLAYDASLQATAKINQTTLLNYI